MNRRAYYTVLTLIIFLGASAGLYFLPNYKELALMYYSDRQYIESYERFKKLYDSGDHSVPVVQPLVKSYLEMAKEDDAIKTLEKFVDEEEEDSEAHEYLLELYEDANRSYDQLHSLEEYYVKNPEEKVLREIIELQNYFELGEKKAQSLELLIKNHKGTEDDYVTLAKYYAAHDQDDQAVDLLLKLLSQNSLMSIGDQNLQFMVHFFAKAGYPKITQQLALAYTTMLPLPDMAVDLAYVLMELGLPDIGLEVLSLLPPDKQSMPIVTYAEINLLIHKGVKGKKLYPILRRRYDNGTLPDIFLDDLITLGATQEIEPEWLMRVIDSVNMEGLKESTLLALFERSIKLQDQNLVKKLLSNLSSEYLDLHPVLELSLVLVDSAYTSTEKNFLLTEYIRFPLSKTQKAKLAGYYYNSGYKGIAKKTLSDVKSLDGFDPEQALSAAFLYAELKLVDKGFRLINQLIDKQRTVATGYEKAWLILATAKGLKSEVLERVDTARYAKDSTFLLDLTSVAMTQKQGKLAAPLAERLWKSKKTVENQGYYAEALVMAGRAREALPLYRHLVVKRPRYLDGYIDALSQIANKDPSVKAELKRTLVQVLDNKHLTAKQRRNIGYILVDNGMEKEAIPAFWALAAKSASIGNPDVEMLISLFGEKPNSKQIAWMVQQTGDNKGEDKGKWLKHLLYVGAAKSVAGLVELSELEHEEIADAYLEALVELKEKEKMAEVIAFILPDETRPQRLRRLGKLAEEGGLQNQAVEVWHKVLVQAPDDKDARVKLGVIYFSQGRYSVAQDYLYQAIQLGVKDYLAYYYYGQVLLANSDKKSAKRYFRDTVELIFHLEEKDLYVRLALANCYSYLDCDDKAADIYCRLFTEKPDDVSVRIEFAAFLIAREKYNDAACLLMREGFPDTSKLSLEEQLSVEFVRIQWLKETNNLATARRCIEKLVALYPENSRVHLAAADIAFSIQNWRQAVCHIRRAEALKPCNEEYPKIEKGINEDYRSWIGYAHEWKKTGLFQMELLDRYHVGKMISPFTQFIAELESDYIRLENFTFANGGLTAPYHGQKWRGELAVEHTTCSGWTPRGSVFIGEGNLGAGLQATRVDPWGKWIGVGEYHKPYWEFIELLIQNGTRDRIGILREQRLTKRFRGVAGIAYHMFNLPEITNVATSIKFDLGITRAFMKQNPLMRLLGEQAFMSFNYLVDAEYHLSRKGRLDLFDVEFFPVPIADRETHSWYFFMSKRFKDVLGFEGYLGVSFDRAAIVKMLAPVGGMSIIFGNKSSVQGKIELSHTTSTEASSQDVDRALIDVRVAY